MAVWSQRLLFLGLILVGFGILLRLCGYHQTNGFLQGELLQNGLTPRAFLMAGATFGIFAAAMANVALVRLKDREIHGGVERTPAAGGNEESGS